MMARRDSEAVKIARLISGFLGDYAPSALTASEHTLKSYRDALTLYICYLESEGVGSGQLGKECFGRQRIEGWIRWLQETRGNSPDTCNVRLASLRAFLDYAASRDVEMLYLYEEAKHVKRQKCPKRKVSGLTRDAVAAMLSAPDLSTPAGRRDLAFMVLLYATGARLGELLSMRMGQVHIDGVPEPHVILVGKGGKVRTAYLLPRAAEHLRRHIAETHGPAPNPDDVVFYSRVGGKGRAMSAPAIDKRLKMHARKARKSCADVPPNVHAHQFRHARASHWIEDGLNIVQVSFLLGHAQLETTMAYIDVTVEEEAKAILGLEADGGATEKKWKGADGSLRSLCGLAR